MYHLCQTLFSCQLGSGITHCQRGFNLTCITCCFPGTLDVALSACALCKPNFGFRFSCRLSGNCVSMSNAAVLLSSVLWAVRATWITIFVRNTKASETMSNESARSGSRFGVLWLHVGFVPYPSLPNTTYYFVHRVVYWSIFSSPLQPQPLTTLAPTSIPTPWIKWMNAEVMIIRPEKGYA